MLPSPVPATGDRKHKNTPLEILGNALLYLSVALLFLALLLSLVRPALAVMLGIASQGVEPFVATAWPVFQNNQTLFNIIVGLVICISFVQAHFRGKLQGNAGFHRRTLALLVWLYVTIYWFSSLWSKFDNATNSIGLLPYMFLYVALLPRMVQAERQMLRAIFVLWLILMLAFAAVLVSPHMLSDSRFVLQGAGGEEESNPLAFADTAVLLSFCSAFLISVRFRCVPAPVRGRILPMGLRILACFGVLLGFACSMRASRGENAIGIISCLGFLALVSARSLHQSFAYLAAALLGGGCLLRFLYLLFYARLTAFSWRFELQFLQSSLQTRGEILSEALQIFSDSGWTIAFGAGARSCEAITGVYPHSSILQSLAETGLLGLGVFIACWWGAFRLAIRKMERVYRIGGGHSKAYIAFLTALLCYAFLITQKKGSLSYHDSYMWILVIASALDRCVPHRQGIIGDASHVDHECASRKVSRPGLQQWTEHTAPTVEQTR